MTVTIQTLSADSIAKLRADHERLRLEVALLHHQVRAHAVFRETSQLAIGKTGGSGISASTGTTITYADVTLQLVHTGTTAIVATSTTVRCHNLAGAVDANEYILMQRDQQGRWWVIVERC